MTESNFEGTLALSHTHMHAQTSTEQTVKQFDLQARQDNDGLLVAFMDWESWFISATWMETYDWGVVVGGDWQHPPWPRIMQLRFFFNY